MGRSVHDRLKEAQEALARVKAEKKELEGAIAKIDVMMTGLDEKAEAAANVAKALKADRDRLADSLRNAIEYIEGAKLNARQYRECLAACETLEGENDDLHAGKDQTGT